MPFFSEHLVYKKGVAEILLKDPVISVSNELTTVRAEAIGQTVYDNRNIKNFVANLITEAGNENLASLRHYVPTNPNADIDEFCCPITLMPMQHPIVAIDGVTYERQALERWLETPNSRGMTPMRGRMVNSDGAHLPMPNNILLTTLIEEHTNRLENEGVEYAIGADFSDFNSDRWTEFLGRAKLRFTAAFASGLIVTLALLRFLESLELPQLAAIVSGTTSVALGTTVGSTAFILTSAINTIDATVTGSTVFSESTSAFFSSQGSHSVSTTPTCAATNNR